MEEVGKKGEVYWVGTRRKKGSMKRYVFEHIMPSLREGCSGVGKPVCFRAVHISDNAPRNFHIFCGKFEIEKENGFEATRKGCKMKKKGRDCVGLKVTI